MKTLQVKSPSELTDSEMVAWRSIVAEDSRFHSPFFHPEYIRAMSQVRPQVEVAVLSCDGRPQGFLPYERHGKSALPLGIKLADFQGLVCTNECEWESHALLRSAGLTACEFDHLVLENSPFSDSVVRVDDSPYMDLSQGYAHYLRTMKDNGSTLISQVQRKRRKLEREVGPIEFNWNDSDRTAWEQMLTWKSDQRARTRTLNILAFPWVQSFLQGVSSIDEFGLQGMVSTLRANGKVIAVHQGMQTEHRLHYWFPTFDPELSRYSPGLVLLLTIAEQAVERGIQRIDLGKGDDAYKASFASGAERLGTATCDLWTPRQLAKSWWIKLQSWIRGSRLKSTAQLPKRIIRRWQVQSRMGRT